MFFPPSHGTDDPLDAQRLDSLLAQELQPAALLPGSKVLPASMQLDILRLSWLWGLVGDAPGANEEEWVEAAAAQIAQTAGVYRNWPIPMATGPGVEAALMEKVPASELEALAARRERITRFLAPLYAQAPKEDYASLRDADPEALGWLGRDDAECDLAGNRFDERVESVAFIQQLYDSGARRVVIASESVRREGRKSWYADAIRVALPESSAQRKALFDILNTEARDQGFDEDRDEGQETLYMWWD
jgi:hypothetical protein